MVEEFHATDPYAGPWKLLYGWGTLNTNIWLPSLVELVGTTGGMDARTGCYYSAMQGLNTSTGVWVDAQGGTQFLYFQQYNTAGGGDAIWNICNQEQTWVRSCVMETAKHAWHTTNTQRFDWGLLTDVYAVHPAVADEPILVCKQNTAN